MKENQDLTKEDKDLTTNTHKEKNFNHITLKYISIKLEIISSLQFTLRSSGPHLFRISW